MPNNLKKVIKEWIRAEFYFRLHRKTAYTTISQEMLVQTERALRRAVTGKGGLTKAATCLNLVVDEKTNRTPNQRERNPDAKRSDNLE